MLSLAGLRYRSALVSDGGPIDSIDLTEFPVFGRRLFQANAVLRPGLVPRRRRGMYSDVNGTGAHASTAVARHMAVSEALERWAFHATVRSERRAEFGFDADESSNGMAAYPGWSHRPARQRASFEALERFWLLNWWEGRIDGALRDTEWPGISALAFEAPQGGVAVLLFGRSNWGFYVYGHAAADSFPKACAHALLELVRHERVVRCRCLVGPDLHAPLSDLFERRAWFFSTPEGHELFQARLAARTRDPQPSPEVICDREIGGPWSRYATVWRFAFRPPSQRFRSDDDRYFFW